jgi:hypothetical protein
MKTGHTDRQYTQAERAQAGSGMQTEAGRTGVKLGHTGMF